MAVADFTGMAILHIFPDSTYLSTLRVDGVQGTTPIEVRVVRLDDLLKDLSVVDFLKIDVENLEASVLAGAAALFERRAVRHLMIEVYVDHEIIADMLDEWGYGSQLITTARGRFLWRPALGPSVRFGAGGNYLVSALNTQEP